MIRNAIVLAGMLMVAYGTWQTVRANNLRVDAVAMQIELQSCGARLANVLEDVRSDQSAAALVDDLSAVPSHWLRPERD